MLDSKFWRIGGVYFDTDVEVIRSLDEIIAKGPFLGEQVKGRVAAGLGMAAEPDMEFYKRVVNLYDNMTFDLSQDSNKQVTVVQHVTDLLIECGYDPQFDGIQTICGINIYPPQYFNPQDFKNVLFAATTAHAKGLKVIGLTGAKDSKLKDMSDVCIKAPQTETYMIQELHLPIYHCLCLMLEDKFYGTKVD